MGHAAGMSRKNFVRGTTSEKGDGFVAFALWGSAGNCQCSAKVTQDTLKHSHSPFVASKHNNLPFCLGNQIECRLEPAFRVKVLALTVLGVGESCPDLDELIDACRFIDYRDNTRFLALHGVLIH